MALQYVTYPALPPGEYDLDVYICPNGGGHHKRVFGALDLVLKAKPETRVAIFADQGTTNKFMNDFPPVQRVAENPNVCFVFGVVSPGLDIMAKDPQVYTDMRWFTWMDRAVSFPRARVAWFDALPQVLAIHTDAIGSSSFTFGPVIKDKFGNREDELGRIARNYAQIEETVMKAWKPVYVCPKMFVMDFMYERARVKETGIMADFEPLPKVKTDPPTVGISGGLGGQAGKQLHEVVEILRQSGKYQLSLDQKTREGFPDLPLLGNDAAAYATLAACVIRPGVGSSTNCITSSIPVVAIHEGDLEMDNNGGRFHQYGLGIQIQKAGEVLAALETILSPEWQEKYAIARSQVSLSGLQELADTILERL